MLAASASVATYGLIAKHPLTIDQIIKAVALLLAVCALALSGKRGEKKMVWYASFCLVSGAFCGAYWISSGVQSFNTLFYGALFLVSLILAISVRPSSRQPDKQH